MAAAHPSRVHPRSVLSFCFLVFETSGGRLSSFMGHDQRFYWFGGGTRRLRHGSGGVHLITTIEIWRREHIIDVGPPLPLACAIHHSERMFIFPSL